MLKLALRCCMLQACVTDRYLPSCDQLAADRLAREGAVCILRHAKQEAKRHLQLAVSAFDPYIGSAASRPETDTEAPPASPAADEDDDELGYSEDEGCEPVDFQDDSDSSEEGDDLAGDVGFAGRNVAEDVFG